MIFNDKRYHLHKQRNYWMRDEKRPSGRVSLLLHRVMWEYYFGAIPEGYHIHHKDGNRSNNCLSNLLCLSPEEHTRLHNSIRKGSGYNSKIQSEWSKKGWKTRRPVQRKCGMCEEEYETLAPQSKWCSHKCSQRNYISRKSL